MPNRGPLRRELCVLARIWISRAQLLELPPHVLLLALTSRAKPFQVRKSIDRGDPARMGGGDGGSQLVRACIGVQQLGLRIHVEEGVVLVLPSVPMRDKATA